MDIFDKRFEKATQTYGLKGAFYFRFIVPIASFFSTEFANAHAEDRELYKMQRKLTSAVEKVQKAYKVFRASERAVNREMDKVAYRQARLTEYIDATEFVVSYKDLIALATLQADQLTAKTFGRKNPGAMDNTRAALFQDIHEAFDEEFGTGKILSSVNSLRARLFVQDPMENPETLRHYYESFVEQFVENHVLAVTQSGDDANSEKVNEALYDGLANVPGIENVLPEYNQKLNLDSSHSTFVREMHEFFLREIKRLVNGNQPVAEQQLAKIKYKGISLLRVVDPAFVEKLEQARRDLIKLRELEAVAQKLGTQTASKLTLRAPHAALLSKKQTYSASDFLEFFQNGALGKSADEINRAINAGQDDIFVFVRQAKQLDAEVQTLQTKNDAEISAEKQAIERQRQALADLQTRFAAENACFNELDGALKTRRQNLEEYNKANAENDTRTKEQAKKSPPLPPNLQQASEIDRKGIERMRQETIAALNYVIAEKEALFRRASEVVVATCEECMEMEREIQTHEADVAAMGQNGSPKFGAALRQKQADFEALKCELTGDELLIFGDQLNRLFKNESTSLMDIQLNDDEPAVSRQVAALVEVQTRIGSDMSAARKADNSCTKIDAELAQLAEATQEQSTAIARLKASITTSGAFAYENAQLNVTPTIFDATSIDEMNNALEDYIDSAKKINKHVVNRVVQIGIRIHQEIDRKEVENQPLTARERQVRTESSLRGQAHRDNDLNGLSAVAVTLPPNPIIAPEPVSAAPASAAPGSDRKLMAPIVPADVAPLPVIPVAPANGQRIMTLTTVPAAALPLAPPVLAVVVSSPPPVATLPVVILDDRNEPTQRALAQRRVHFQEESGFLQRLFRRKAKATPSSTPVTLRSALVSAPAVSDVSAQAALPNPVALLVSAPAGSRTALMLPVTVVSNAASNGLAQGAHIHFKSSGFMHGLSQWLKELLGIPIVHNLSQM